MDDPTQTVKYNGHDVRLYAWHGVHDTTYTAMYEVAAPDQLTQRGVVAGGFTTAQQAEAAALSAATKWIDQNPA